MKKYKTVVVAGCSFSASNPLDSRRLVNPGETYGDIVANHFGAKCYNTALSGDSFQRMGRKIYEWCAKNKDKFNDTLIILGMTSLDRYEMWNNKEDRWLGVTGNYWGTDDDDDAPAEKYILENQAVEIPWLVQDKKKYFVNFYNNKAQLIINDNILIGLQSFLTLNNIDHVFFDALRDVARASPYHTVKHTFPPVSKHGPAGKRSDLVTYKNWYKNPKYASMEKMTEENPDMRVAADDKHPNKKAHKYWAKCLIEFINEKV